MKTTNSYETSARGISKERKKPFKVSPYRQFEYSKATPAKVVIRQFIDRVVFSTFTLRMCVLCA